MRKLFICTFIAGLLLASGSARAQKYSIQTNLVDWATLFTINAEMGFSVAQHFTLNVGARYNPWSIEKTDGNPLKLQQTTFYAGFRYWPWYVNSGFWVGAKAQTQSFHLSGFRIPFTGGATAVDGTGGFGPGLSLGYAFMLNESMNLEVGLGGWVPYYQNLGLRVLPDFVSLSVVYVF